MLDQILELLKNPVLQGFVAMLIAEIAMRFKQTEKPLSLLHVLVGILRIATKVIAALADFADKVLPQKLSASAADVISIEKK